MSTTETTARAHALIRREGPRPGAYHAALWTGEGWQTACGELLTDGPRGTINEWLPGAEAAEQLQRAIEQGQPICRRCDRVGETVDR